MELSLPGVTGAAVAFEGGKVTTAASQQDKYLGFGDVALHHRYVEVFDASQVRIRCVMDVATRAD